MRITCFFSVIIFYLLMMAGPADAAKASFASAEKVFLEGKYNQAIYEADAAIGSGYGQKDELYYLKGVSQLKLGKFDEARRTFDYIISRHPRSKRIFEAYMGKGDSYLLQGDAGKALGVYNEMQSRFPEDKNIAVLYERLSACYGKLGLRDKAAIYAEKAKSASPLSFEAMQAIPTGVAAGSAITKIPAPSQQAPEVQRFAVQVGVFKNRRNADRLARKLDMAGYEVRVEIPVSARDKLYRVKVGRPGSREAAEVLASRLVRDGYKTKICVDEACD